MTHSEFMIHTANNLGDERTDARLMLMIVLVADVEANQGIESPWEALVEIDGTTYDFYHKGANLAVLIGDDTKPVDKLNGTLMVCRFTCQECVEHPRDIREHLRVLVAAFANLPEYTRITIAQ